MAKASKPNPFANKGGKTSTSGSGGKGGGKSGGKGGGGKAC